MMKEIDSLEIIEKAQEDQPLLANERLNWIARFNIWMNRQSECEQFFIG